MHDRSNISLRGLGFDTELLEYRHPAGTYRCTIRHVEGAVFHLTQEGYVDEGSITHLCKMFRKIREALSDRYALTTCVVINEITTVTGGSIFAKRHLREQFAQWPGVTMIGVGGSGFVNIVGKILARLTPTVSIYMVKTLSDAMPIARACDPLRGQRPSERFIPAEPILPDLYRERFDLLLDSISRVTWDERFVPLRFDIPPDDPFFDLFAAITAMHNDILEMIARSETSRREAEAANHQKDRLVADVSHELKSPLTGIVLLCDMFCATQDRADAARYAEKIRAASLRMGRIIDEILEMARLDAGRAMITTGPIDLKNGLAPLFEQFAAESERKGLSFEVHISDDIPERITGDLSKVQQILHNLLSNAVKYTDTGGITVSFDPNEEGGPGSILITVTDSGLGMTPEEQRNLFERFSRTGVAVDEHRPGTGLGLAISRELARAMGGDISVESSPDGGSTFTLSLFPVKGDQGLTERRVGADTTEDHHA